MKFLRTTCVAFAALMMMSTTSCQKEKYSEFGDGLYAEFVTSKGTMVARLAYDKVPVTVANFVALAEGQHPMVSEEYKDKPYYNGLIFHRVMNNFMIQGGDPMGNGRGNPGYRFFSEFDESLLHNKPGILSMANSGGLGTNGSQFFITEVPYPSLDYIDAQGNLKNCDQPRVSCHSVFGELVMGLEVQDSISNVRTDRANKPEEDVVLQEVNIIRQGFDARKFDAVKIWETELPKLEEKIETQREEARKKAEEARRLAEQKAQEAAANTVVRLNEYKAKGTAMPSGLIKYIITEGNGVKPKQGQGVTIFYEGYHIDGVLFDSNVKEIEESYGKLNPEKERRGMYNPMPMQISPDAQIIQGFKEGVASMSVGERAFFYIPSHLGYGEAGRGIIKPNTDLTFIIEMVEIKE